MKKKPETGTVAFRVLLSDKEEIQARLNNFDVPERTEALKLIDEITLSDVLLNYQDRARIINIWDLNKNYLCQQSEEVQNYIKSFST